MNVNEVTGGITKGLLIGKKFITDNAPIILTVKAGIGIVTTAVLASRATAQSVKQIEAEEASLERKLEPKEKFNLCWKNYIPTAVEVILSAGCLATGVKSLYKDNKSKAAIILGYEELFAKARDKFKKELSENLIEELSNSNPNNPPPEVKPMLPEKNYILGEDQVICYEPYTNQTFVATKTDLDYISNQLQAMHLQNAANGIDTCVNDGLYFFGLERSHQLGDGFGWRFEDTRVISLKYDSTLLDGKTPAMMVQFYPEPYIIL